MVADPRMSDQEMAAINAAAVTREYRVQPHLGKEFRCPWYRPYPEELPDYRTVSAING